MKILKTSPFESWSPKMNYNETTTIIKKSKTQNIWTQCLVATHPYHYHFHKCLKFHKMKYYPSLKKFVATINTRQKKSLMIFFFFFFFVFVFLFFFLLSTFSSLIFVSFVFPLLLQEQKGKNIKFLQATCHHQRRNGGLSASKVWCCN